MINWREKEKQENASKKSDAYRDSEGAWRWNSSKRVPFDDMLETWNLSDADLKASREARDKDNTEFIREYRNRMANHVYSSESLYEMRAAFGKGARVVNIITGKTIQL